MAEHIVLNMKQCVGKSFDVRDVELRWFKSDRFECNDVVRKGG